MTVIPFTADSNIFLYSLDTRDALKHAVALQVFRAMLGKRATLPLQCLTESYAVCVRKPIASMARVRTAIEEAQRSLHVVPSESSDLTRAMVLHQQYRLQFFDALLLSTALRTGCTVLFSEDMQDGQTYGGITVRNPFTMSQHDLDALLA